MMVHLDFATDDVDAAVAWAIEAGASVAEFQPQPHVKVMLDPAGHPFCLFPRRRVAQSRATLRVAAEP